MNTTHISVLAVTYTPVIVVLAIFQALTVLCREASAASICT